MRVIGVVDLLAGRAVHARAGQRDRYAPVQAVAGLTIETGDALALARAYVHRLGLTELYVADLDAILGRLRVQSNAGASHAEAPGSDRTGAKAGRAPQDTLVAAIAALGAPLWLDAGASSIVRARHALDLGAARVVVGLETLPSYDALDRICASVGGDTVAFSLDLRNGAPIVMPGAIRDVAVPVIATRAARAGAGAMIVIDLARVGTGAGLDLDVIARVRDAAPNVLLLAGGGVRGIDDLAQLAEAGCDGALVATALHDGRLGAGDVAAAERLARHGRATR